MREVSRYVIVGCSVLVATLAVNMTRGTDGEDALDSPSILKDIPAIQGSPSEEGLAAAAHQDAGETLDPNSMSPENINQLALLRADEEGEVPFTVDGPEDFPQLRERLIHAPNDREVLDRLSALHARGFERPQIMALIEDLAQAHPNAAALSETLADLYIQQGTFAAAAENFRKVLQVSDQPMRVRTMLTFSLLRQGEFEQAITAAQEQHRMAGEYLTGKRDASHLKEKVEDEHIFIPCLFEAVALAKLDKIEKARKVLDACGQGIVSDATRGHFIDFANLDVNALRDTDIASLLQ